jgi:hypothetical protein
VTLLAVQQVVSRVLTDPVFRESFFREPESASVAYPLSERELASLVRLDQARVGASAEMLLRDRVEFALSAFPASALILRPLMAELAPRLAREFPPVPTEDPRLEREGERFATLVLGLLAAGELGPEYLGDVVVFERAMSHLWNSEEAWRSAEELALLARLQPSSPSADDVLASVPRLGEHVTVGVFDYDVVDLTDRLTRGEVPESPPRQPTIIVLTRAVDGSGIRRQRVNGLTRDLLSLCDGTRTGQAVVGELAGRASAERTVAVLCRLREGGVVGLTAGPESSCDDRTAGRSSG